MIDTLPFEIDGVTYAKLKKELFGRDPRFKGKLSPRLPRLINQWVADDRRPPQPKGPSASAGLVPSDGAGAALKSGAPPAGARLPRLVNQWPSDVRRALPAGDRRPERRRHERIVCTMMIEYQVASRIYVDFVRNISRSGAYLETSAGVAMGNSVILRMPLLRGPEILRIRGVVVRMDDAGVGIMFQELLDK